MGNGFEKTCGFNRALRTESPEPCPSTDIIPKTGRCIFHTPVGQKDPGAFWQAFFDHLELAGVNYETAETEKAGETVLDCRGFQFPLPEKRLTGLEFPMKVRFDKTAFQGNVDFAGVVFEKGVSFNEAQFYGTVDFISTKTIRGAFFKETVFRGYVCFIGVQFEDVKFNRAVFKDGALFTDVRVYGDIDLSVSTFEKDTEFFFVNINGKANFANAEFYGVTWFIMLINDPEQVGTGKIRLLPAEVKLSGVNQKSRGDLIFMKLDLGLWTLAETPVIAEAAFYDVKWTGDGEIKRKHTLDEVLAKRGDITFEAAAEVYRRLRLNFESRLAYEAASDFHIGQMEMLYKNPDTGWWKRRFLWLYRAVSNFGESVSRPLIWLAVLWLFFTVLWSFKGFPYNGGSVNFDLTWPWSISADLEMAKSIGRSLLYSFKTFLTLPDLKGGVVSQTIGTVQRLAGASVITLFILALRRAFRR